MIAAASVIGAVLLTLAGVRFVRAWREITDAPGREDVR